MGTPELPGGADPAQGGAVWVLPTTDVGGTVSGLLQKEEGEVVAARDRYGTGVTVIVVDAKVAAQTLLAYSSRSSPLHLLRLL